MPEKAVKARAERDKRQGKSVSTQAGEFVREEFHHVREGKHGARSPRQAIAIGLSKARRAGVKLHPPGRGTTSQETRERAEHDLERGQRGARYRASSRRSRATSRALRREGHAAASSRAIGTHSRQAARRRSPRARSQSARRAARSRTHAGRAQGARRGARTRARASSRS